MIKAAAVATQDKRPVVYLCHSGLTDLAAPIIVQDEYIGAFLAGQVVLETEHSDIKEVKEEMYRRVADLPVDKEKIGELFDHVEIVPEHRIKAGADLILYHVQLYCRNWLGEYCAKTADAGDEGQGGAGKFAAGDRAEGVAVPGQSAFSIQYVEHHCAVGFVGRGGKPRKWCMP